MEILIMGLVLSEIVCFLLGLAAGAALPKKKKTEYEGPQDSEEEEREKLSPYTLRNGSGVTKNADATFAEQIVNIMNYNGKNQKEEAFDEKEN
jgi:uncharacterized protein CbrC (UPF0167 family)